MVEGIVIILVVGVGIAFLLYQVFKNEGRESGTSEKKMNLKNALTRLWQRNAPGENRTVQRTSAPAGQPSPERRASGRPLVPASLDHITETGPMVYFANDRHGKWDKEYRFNFKKVGQGWRAYILRMPGIGNRDAGGNVIHRLHDNAGYYICWDREVATLKDMQIIARKWADCIQNYIYTGRFE